MRDSRCGTFLLDNLKVAGKFDGRLHGARRETPIRGKRADCLGNAYAGNVGKHTVEDGHGGSK